MINQEEFVFTIKLGQIRHSYLAPQDTCIRAELCLVELPNGDVENIVVHTNVIQELRKHIHKFNIKHPIITDDDVDCDEVA